MLTLGIVIGIIDIAQGNNELQFPQNSSQKLRNDGTYLVLHIKFINTNVISYYEMMYTR